MHLLAGCLTAALLVGAAMANMQAWSEQATLNMSHTFSCNFTNGNVSVSTEDTLIWSKFGIDTEIKTDTYYRLHNGSGVTNLYLEIVSVTPDMAGIYFCNIMNKSGMSVERVVKGLNIAGPIYDDKFEEYKTPVIRGVISAAAVFTFVVGICLIDRFKYLTDEQKQKRRDGKLDRLRRLQPSRNGGVDNPVMQDGAYRAEKNNGSLQDTYYGNTHL